MEPYEANPKLLKNRVHKLQMWLADMMEHSMGVMATRAMVWTLVVNGVFNWTRLHTVTTRQLDRWFPVDGQTHYALKTLVNDQITRYESDRRFNDAKRRKMELRTNAKVCSMKDALNDVSDKHFMDLKVAIKEASDQMGLDDIFDATPAEMVKRAVQMRDKGLDVTDILAKRAELCSMSTKQHSLAAAGSALSHWADFATKFMGYHENAILPPRDGDDARQWLTTFRNAGRAANYLGAVR